MHSMKSLILLLLIIQSIDLHSHNAQAVSPSQIYRAIKQDKPGVLEKSIYQLKYDSAYSKLWSALFFHAIQFNARKIIAHFLKHGFDLETRSSAYFQRTPLHHALARANKQTILLLMKHGAPLDAKDQLGSTPLHLTAQRGLTWMTKLLLAKQANVNEPDELKYTPLHAAIEQGNIRNAKLLLEAGANINAQTCNGDTPLHLALASYAHNPDKAQRKKNLKKIISLLGAYHPDLTKCEVYNRWTVFELLNNLDLKKREYKELLTLLKMIKTNLANKSPSTHQLQGHGQS